MLSAKKHVVNGVCCKRATEFMLTMKHNIRVRPVIIGETLQDVTHRTTERSVIRNMSSRWRDMQHCMCIFACFNPKCKCMCVPVNVGALKEK